MPDAVATPPSTTKLPGGTALEWVTFKHPEYEALRSRWDFIRDHYTAEVLATEKVTQYLLQKKRGESNDAFLERCRCADYTNHFAAIVDGLVGTLATIEDDANRVWGPSNAEGVVQGLGSDQVDGTVASRLWRNVDGRGTGYPSFWHKVAIELGLVHVTWLFADNPSQRGAVLRNLEAETVTNWLPGPDGEILEAMIEEQADTRQTLKDRALGVKQYLHLYLEEGRYTWQRYRADDRGRVTPFGAVGGGKAAFLTDTKVPTLPLKRVVLPLNRQVGHYLAKKANALFNRESERDHLLRVANFPKFLHKGDATSFEAVKKAFAEGSNLIHGDGGFDAPPTDSATLATEVLEKKAREYYMTAAREYGDAAKERTATELKQNAASGTHAFLALLSRQLDAAETTALHFVEQIEFADKPARQFQARVTRSTNFLPTDPDALVDRLITRVWGPGQPVPLGRAGQVAAAKQVADYLGLEVDPDELTAAVDVVALLKLLQPGISLPLPAEARAQIVAKALAAQQLIDPEDTVELADGQKANLLQIVLAKAQALAESQDQAAQREAEVFGRGPVGPPPPPPPAGGE